MITAAIKLAFVVGLIIALVAAPFAPLMWAGTTYDGVRRDSVHESRWKEKWGWLAYVGLIVLSYAAYASLLAHLWALYERLFF